MNVSPARADGDDDDMEPSELTPSEAEAYEAFYTSTYNSMIWHCEDCGHPNSSDDAFSVAAQDGTTLAQCKECPRRVPWPFADHHEVPNITENGQ